MHRMIVYDSQSCRILSLFFCIEMILATCSNAFSIGRVSFSRRASSLPSAPFGPHVPFAHISNHCHRKHQSILQMSTTDESSSISQTQRQLEEAPLYRAEGIFAVAKPMDWTSNNVVSYIRGILERDARQRGAKPVKVGSRHNKNRIIRVGHGGTLDPLATGVLVIGVGKGTKELQSFLSGSKRYRAEAELGFETTTLDMEGNVTKRAPFDHVTEETLIDAIPSFVGEIQQIPPIFSAIRKDGKKLYESARKGLDADDMEIEPRTVHVIDIQLTSVNLPKFAVEVECGGGTYIRSLIRDIGYHVDSVATTTLLERTQQGQFTLNKALAKDDWTADNFYTAIERTKAMS